MKLMYSFCFFLLSYINYAQQIDSFLSKDEILIGDTVSLKLSITAPDSLQLKFGKDLEFNTKIEVLNDVFTTQKINQMIKYEFDYTLTSWEAGRYLVKSIPFAINDSLLPSKTFRLNVISPEVSENSEEIFPIKPILEENVTWWEANKKYMAYMVAGIILLLIVTYLIYLYVKDRAKNKYVSKPLLPPYEEAKQNLKLLDKKELLKKDKIKDYYTDLSFIIRRYFDRRFDFPALAFISEDLIYFMRNKEQLSQKEADIVLDFLKKADLIKYAKATATEEESLIYRTQIEKIIDNTKPLLETEVLDHA